VTAPYDNAPPTQRLALGVAYRGGAYNGWQAQPDGRTVQDTLERALSRFTGQPVRTLCAGRTDAGVHALNQVVHFDTALRRETASWVRGTNSHLPADVAVQWCSSVPPDFHARNAARRRRYVYVLLQSAVRPALEQGLVGWVFRPLDAAAMRAAAALLLGEHDFTSFRAAACQARSPVKTLHRVDISQLGAYWAFDFEGSAFLHHMVRNLMGCLLAVGMGKKPPLWLAEVLAAKDRALAAPTFSAEGLYFMGPTYDADLGLPQHTPAVHWLPGGFALNSAPATMLPHEPHPHQDLWPDPRK
jgi:tRNA pseudouridine38-40 synthase